jgi:predicted transcriptional regulator YheO
MDNEEREKLSQETLENMRKLVPNYESLMDNFKTMLVTREMEQYNKGWAGAMKHYKDQIIKDLLNDGVLSTNVDVNHLERIVQIIEGCK